MLVSTPIEVLGAYYGREKAIRWIAEAGFDAYDMSLFDFGSGHGEFEGDGWRERARYYRALSDSLGIVCNQSHAPFPSSYPDPAQTEERFELIVRAMEIAAIAGAKSIVVHPVQHLPYIHHIGELKEMNRDFYTRLLPYAERFGINIATENMWQVMSMWAKDGWSAVHPVINPIVDSTCASAEEFVEYVDMIDSDRLVACLDIGHVQLVHRDLPEMIRALGPRLQALHVHDNDGKDDLHDIPFCRTGVVDFDAVTDALAEIGYQGDITFETDAFLHRIPEALIPEALRYLCAVGRYLAAEIQRKTK